MPRFKTPAKYTDAEFANLCLSHVDLSCVSVTYRNEKIPRVLGALRATTADEHDGSRWAVKMPVLSTAVPSEFHRPVPGIGWLRREGMWSVHVKGKYGMYVHLGNYGKLLDACVVRMAHDMRRAVGIFRMHERSRLGKDTQDPNVYYLRERRVWTCDLIRPYVKGSPRSPGIPENLGAFETFEDAAEMLDGAHKALRIGAYSPTAYSKRKAQMQPHGFELVDGIYQRSADWLAKHGV